VIKKDSPYDYPALAPDGQFLYGPVPWHYKKISPEGLRFDQVSIYYYYTSARKYFEKNFGYI
jgi:hypothetical protein